MTFKAKRRAEELEKERKHYQQQQIRREANKKTREARALKLQQEENQTDEEKRARKLEQHRNYRQRHKQKQEMCKEQLIGSIPIKVAILDSHQMTMR